MIATRQAYGQALAEIGADERIVVLDADLSKSTMTALFKEKYPERFFNCGIAEGNMMAVSAGLAAAGKVVFASSFAIFAAGRAWEQIRNSICYPNLNVKICATHAGISVGEDGATHQAIEDIAIMRAIPGMVVISPADGEETKAAVKWAAEYEGPVYIRLGRLAVPDVRSAELGVRSFEVGKGTMLREGNDVAIIATGLLVHKALEAAAELEKEGISARVINMASIKPIDRDIIIAAAREAKGIVTAEEHNIYGGLGSAVAEVVCQHAPCRIEMVGVEDKFGRSGKPDELLSLYGLTAANIIEKCQKILKA
ncbi:MAG: transketolase family protein [Oscillospiraceae bacterium]|nr:transketolase family protein [Oscillospiraceae bacterium]